MAVVWREMDLLSAFTGVFFTRFADVIQPHLVLSSEGRAGVC